MTLAGSRPDDLIGGSVESVRRIQAQLGSFARVAGGGQDHLVQLRSQGWVGRAGDAFRSAVGEVPAKLGDAARSFDEAAAALGSYADVLAQAKIDARRAIDLAADGDHQTDAWARSWQRYRSAVAAAETGTEVTIPPRPSQHDPGAWERSAAERILDDARHRLEAEADRLTSALDRAGSRAPDKPGLLSRAWGGISQFGLGVWDATYGLAEFAWSMSPTRMLIDPEGWAEDVEALGEGIWYGVQNPGEFAKAVTNWDMWMDNPARALGQLVPDLVLTLATAGGGAAVTGARRGMDTADTLSDLGRASNRLDDAADLGDAGRHLDDLTTVTRADGAPPDRPRCPQPRPDDPDTPAIVLTETGDRMGDFASRIPPITDTVDVAIHADTTHVFVNHSVGSRLTHRELARLIESSPKFNGQEIRLVACRSGELPNGVAQNLANKLGVPVVAPTRTVWVTQTGRLIVGDGPTAFAITDPGEWVRFVPGGGQS